MAAYDPDIYNCLRQLRDAQLRDDFDELEVSDPEFGLFSIGEKPEDGIALKHVEVIISGLAEKLDERE